MSQTTPTTTSAETFDSIASNYDVELQRGLRVSGESKEYFAENRVKWLARRLSGLGFVPRRILDFGCGTGSSTPYLLGLPGAKLLVGTDVSTTSLDVARREHGSDRAMFEPLGSRVPRGDIDLAFCNGVFHHIPLEQRSGAVEHIHRSLRPGGMFAYWENNPLNPGTRIVMSRCRFDRDAITLTGGQSRKLLRAAGFEVVRTDFLFIFPSVLRWMRWAEPLVCSLPMGAQYMVLCRKATTG